MRFYVSLFIVTESEIQLCISPGWKLKQVVSPEQRVNGRNVVRETIEIATYQYVSHGMIRATVRDNIKKSINDVRVLRRGIPVRVVDGDHQDSRVDNKPQKFGFAVWEIQLQASACMETIRFTTVD